MTASGSSWGGFGGLSSLLVPDEPFTFLDVRLRNQLPYLLKAGHNTVIYVLEGSLLVMAGDEVARVNTGQARAVSGSGETATLQATDLAHLLVLTGTAIDEPLVEQGPFIMNEQAQIQAAIARYHSGAMGELSPI